MSLASFSVTIRRLSVLVIDRGVLAGLAVVLSCVATVSVAHGAQAKMWAISPEQDLTFTEPRYAPPLVVPDPAQMKEPRYREWINRWGAGPAGIPWTETTLELIVKYQQNPLRAARVLAYLHVAMNDSLVRASMESRDRKLQNVALHGAASAVLDYFYPQETAGRLGALGYSAALAAVNQHPVSRDDFAKHWTLGHSVAEFVLRRAKEDGADAGWNPAERPPHAPGRWEAAPPLNVYKPAEPRAGSWRTWVLKNGSEIPAPPPPAYDTPAYWTEAEQVRLVTKNLTAEQKKIAEDWHLGQGTVTPAGVWNRHALDLARRKKLDTTQTARMFAALNVAMMDAFIACWDVKFRHWTARPVTVIRAKLDSDFLPHLITPPFPSYVSGHATVSGAAAEVLSAFFPKEATAFRKMADEAARSRLYGGIHFNSDNEEGLRLGKQIGEKTIKLLNGPAAGSS